MIKTEILQQLNLGVIYLLLEGGVVRYVGQTTRDPSSRLAEHLSKDTGTHKGNWIKKLKIAGNAPRLLIYKVVYLSDLDAAEMETIECFRALGCPLVNSTDGGCRLSKEDRAKISLRQRGMGNASAKLTETEVEQIYHDYSNTDISQAQLAEEYNCDVKTINQILNGQKWSHLWRCLSKDTKNRIKAKKTERNPSKLPKSDVFAIYEAYGQYSLAALAQDYRRSKSTIRDILTGKTYRRYYADLDEDRRSEILALLAGWRDRAGRPKL